MKLVADNLFAKNPRKSSLKLSVPYEKDTTIDAGCRQLIKTLPRGTLPYCTSRKLLFETGQCVWNFDDGSLYVHDLAHKVTTVTKTNA